MKIRSQGKALAMALAITAGLSMSAANVSPVYAYAYDMPAHTLVLELQKAIEVGNVARAKALIARLEAMGVVNIVIDGQTISVAMLVQLVSTNPQQIITILTAGNVTNLTAAFQVANVTETSKSEPKPHFPTSSAG